MTKGATMAELFDVRERAGIYEVLKMIEVPGGETWEPLGGFTVRNWCLESKGVMYPVTIADALHAEGWLAPWEELPVCGAHSRKVEGKRCLLRRGHEGDHADGGLRWEEGF